MTLNSFSRFCYNCLQEYIRSDRRRKEVLGVIYTQRESTFYHFMLHIQFIPNHKMSMKEKCYYMIIEYGAIFLAIG